MSTDFWQKYTSRFALGLSMPRTQITFILRAICQPAANRAAWRVHRSLGAR